MDARQTHAVELMNRFAERTGLTAEQPLRRYLWTDAFAVCNFLGLARATGDQTYVDRALGLVDRVHEVLGSHRPDDSRRGRLSGLPEPEARAHPTVAGLRIGKPLRERAADEPFDDRLEWDRDGQYFHYLTKWMHALGQVGRATGDTRFNHWARELADTAHRAFVYSGPDGRRRMYWKLSIDLSRPLVSSMGQHDPLDGLIRCLELSAGNNPGEPRLDRALGTFASLVEPRALATADPLGIGGLLVDAHCLAQLEERAPGSGLLEALLDAAHRGLAHFATQADLHRPAAQRLGFRELGLSIGIAACTEFEWPAKRSVQARLERLSSYRQLRADIDGFWLEPGNRRAASWLAHEDINDVMLATSLEPAGFLLLAPGRHQS